MSWTYAQIRSAVAEALGDPTGGNTLALADSAIKLAIVWDVNMQPWWFNFEPDEQITLVTGQREYTLASPLQSISSIWYLDAAATKGESPVLTLGFDTFVKAGFHNTDQTGRPDVASYNENTGKLELNRAPTATENGRKISVAYYVATANPPSTVNDETGALIVECATWRIRRGVPGYDWVTDKQNSKIDMLKLRAMKRVYGRFTSGHK